MNEQLIVKNFGPIKDATVDFKRVTVFIGPTGGGKSTLAKLAAVFRDIEFYISQSGPGGLFEYYGLTNFFYKNSEIKLFRGDYWVKSKGYKITYDTNTRRIINNQAKYATKVFSERSAEKLPALANTLKSAAKSANLNNNDLNSIISSIQDITDDLVQDASIELIKIVFRRIFFSTNPAYIPAERILVSSLNNSWIGLLRDDIGLPPTLLSFANNYAQFRTIIKEVYLPFLNTKYIHRSDEDFISSNSNSKLIGLHEAASGIQSVAPLIVLLEYLNKSGNPQSFIIEEPELNLYPTAQQGLLNWLVEKCTKGENDLTITTHSPYILSHFNLLLYAYQVAEQHPERADEVAELVPRESWINPKEFACYQVENGGVASLVNEDLGLIDDNGLDGLSGDAADAFDNLIRLSKGVALK